MHIEICHFLKCILVYLFPDRRCKMTSETMTDVMRVKLETSDVTSFDPTAAIDLWAVSFTTANNQSESEIKVPLKFC